VIKLYGLLAIIFLLRLHVVPRDCWLVVVLGQNERRCPGRWGAQQFCFSCFTCICFMKTIVNCILLKIHFLVQTSNNTNEIIMHLTDHGNAFPYISLVVQSPKVLGRSLLESTRLGIKRRLSIKEEEETSVEIL
jgi:hypothetical protein